MADLWVMESLRSNHTKTLALFAYWEAAYDPMSDDYIPEEIAAAPLFDMWAATVARLYPGGLIPIFWFVKGHGFLEGMPHEYNHYDHTPENLLTYFTHPVHKETGQRLNWAELPVSNKLWDKRHGDKGGFIQSATGWKPSPLQPFVYLPTLREARYLKEKG